jgi:radical SAM superfamily enzyme YgiQ (UPF0313 family)
MSKNMFGILFGDNHFFGNNETSGTTSRNTIGRSTGVHRVATLMRERNVQVEVLDFFNAWTDDELITYVNKFPKIDFIGFGINLSPLKEEKVNLLISKVKTLHPTAKVIVGGSSVLDKAFSEVDLFFKGFTESAIDDIIEYLQTGKFNPFLVEKIKTHDLKTIVNCTKHYPNISTTELKTVYVDSDFIKSNEALGIELSRGCVFKCKFCNFPLVGKNKNDYIRDKEEVKQELINNYNKWGTTRYIVTDDTFNDNEIKVDMLYEITNELDFKLSMVSYIRVDLLYAKKGTLDKLIKSGVKAFFFGIESLNERTSKSVNKGLTGDKLKNYLIEIKTQYPQLHITASLIVGLPYESLETFNDNLDWVVESKIFDSIVIQPLAIYADNSINDISPFSREWKNYGYEIMTDDEIDEKIKSFPPGQNIKEIILKYRYDHKFKNHLLPWKNEYMTFLDAAITASQSRTKISKFSNGNAGFSSFAMAFNKDTVEEILHTKTKNINFMDQVKDAILFIEEYKAKKLAI